MGCFGKIDMLLNQFKVQICQAPTKRGTKIVTLRKCMKPGQG
jgi:hypothetical protein